MNWQYSATDVLTGIARQPLMPESHIFWLYLTSASAIALTLYWRRDSITGSLSIRNFLAYLLPGHVYTHRSTVNDLILMFTNSLLYSLFLFPLVLSSGAVAELVWLGLHHIAGPVQQPLSGAANTMLMTIVILLAADLAFYVSHWLHHKVPLLWEFHKVHHSAEVLTPLTVFRRHPVEMIIDGCVSGVLVGGAYGVFDFLSAGTLEAYTLAGVNAGVFLFLLAGFNLQHSHIWFSYGCKLEHLFISPALHQIHHSKDSRHFDHNMGNVFAIWDWLFGTLYVPAGREQLKFGLAHNEEREYVNVSRLYCRPMRSAAFWAFDALRRACCTASKGASYTGLRTSPAVISLTSATKPKPYTRGAAMDVLRWSVCFAFLWAPVISTPVVAAQEFDYAARLAGNSRIQGKVVANGITWNCRGNTCTTSGPWPVPGVASCNALATRVGSITSYGHKGRQLSRSELDHCNKGVVQTSSLKISPVQTDSTSKLQSEYAAQAPKEALQTGTSTGKPAVTPGTAPSKSTTPSNLAEQLKAPTIKKPVASTSVQGTNNLNTLQTPHPDIKTPGATEQTHKDLSGAPKTPGVPRATSIAAQPMTHLDIQNVQPLQPGDPGKTPFANPASPQLKPGTDNPLAAPTGRNTLSPESRARLSAAPTIEQSNGLGIPGTASAAAASKSLSPESDARLGGVPTMKPSTGLRLPADSNALSAESRTHLAGVRTIEQPGALAVPTTAPALTTLKPLAPAPRGGLINPDIAPAQDRDDLREKQLAAIDRLQGPTILGISGYNTCVQHPGEDGNPATLTVTGQRFGNSGSGRSLAVTRLQGNVVATLDIRSWSDTRIVAVLPPFGLEIGIAYRLGILNAEGNWISGMYDSVSVCRRQHYIAGKLSPHTCGGNISSYSVTAESDGQTRTAHLSIHPADDFAYAYELANLPAGTYRVSPHYSGPGCSTGVWAPGEVTVALSHNDYSRRQDFDFNIPVLTRGNYGIIYKGISAQDLRVRLNNYGPRSGNRWFLAGDSYIEGPDLGLPRRYIALPEMRIDVPLDQATGTALGCLTGGPLGCLAGSEAGKNLPNTHFRYYVNDMNADRINLTYEGNDAKINVHFETSGAEIKGRCQGYCPSGDDDTAPDASLDVDVDIWLTISRFTVDGRHSLSYNQVRVSAARTNVQIHGPCDVAGIDICNKLADYKDAVRRGIEDSVRQAFDDNDVRVALARRVRADLDQDQSGPPVGQIASFTVTRNGVNINYLPAQ